MKRNDLLTLAATTLFSLLGMNWPALAGEKKVALVEGTELKEIVTAREKDGVVEIISRSGELLDTLKTLRTNNVDGPGVYAGEHYQGFIDFSGKQAGKFAGKTDGTLKAYNVPKTESDRLSQEAMNLNGQKQPQAALELINRAIALSGETPKLLIRRAGIRYNLQDRQGAIEDASQALEMGRGTPAEVGIRALLRTFER